WRGSRACRRCRDRAAGTSLDDVVVRDAAIVVEHHLPHVLGYHCNLGIGAGKFADGIERAPPGDDEELHAALNRTAQDARVDEPGDARELRESIASQV